MGEYLFALEHSMHFEHLCMGWVGRSLHYKASHSFSAPLLVATWGLDYRGPGSQNGFASSGSQQTSLRVGRDQNTFSWDSFPDLGLIKIWTQKLGRWEIHIGCVSAKVISEILELTQLNGKKYHRAILLF